MSLLLALTGGGATSYSLACDAGAYVLTGNSASLSVGRSLQCSAGAYAITGQDAALSVGHVLDCAAGAYSIVGNDATLTYAPASGVYTLICDSGSYIFTGNDANFVYVKSSASPSNSGGYFPGYVKRKKSIEEDRQELGIVPKKVKKIIKKVLEETIKDSKSEEQAKAILKIALENQELQYKKEYDLALEQYRSKTIAFQIKQLIHARIAKENEDDEESAAILLLM